MIFRRWLSNKRLGVLVQARINSSIACFSSARSEAAGRIVFSVNSRNSAPPGSANGMVAQSDTQKRGCRFSHACTWGSLCVPVVSITKCNGSSRGNSLSKRRRNFSHSWCRCRHGRSHHLAVQHVQRRKKAWWYRYALVVFASLRAAFLQRQPGWVRF